MFASLLISTGKTRNEGVLDKSCQWNSGIEDFLFGWFFGVVLGFVCLGFFFILAFLSLCVTEYLHPSMINRINLQQDTDHQLNSAFLCKLLSAMVGTPPALHIKIK